MERQLWFQRFFFYSANSLEFLWIFFRFLDRTIDFYLLFQQSSVSFWIIDRTYFLLVIILLFAIFCITLFLNFHVCISVWLVLWYLAGTTNLIIILWYKFSWRSLGFYFWYHSLWSCQLSPTSFCQKLDWLKSLPLKSVISGFSLFLLPCLLFLYWIWLFQSQSIMCVKI